LWITHNIQELDNVGASAHVLQDFDFSFDFLLFDWFKNFDDTLGVVHHIDTFKDLFEKKKTITEIKTPCFTKRALCAKQRLAKVVPHCTFHVQSFE
jgi:hypothetical protein